jgi:FKBP-type peptidyl-prolyl cis-trans isomerase
MKLMRTMMAVLLAAGCLTVLAGCGDEEDDAKEITVVTAKGPVVLKYIDVVEGKGATVKSGDIISFHYTGWTRGGYKIHSSHDKGKPAKMKVGEGQGLLGWHHGIPEMKVGGKRKLFIPPELGFKDQGSPDGAVKPNTKLTYEIEVLKILDDLDDQ